MKSALVLSDDLLFASQVTGAGAVAGYEVKIIREPATLLEQAAATPPTIVFVDLQVAGTALANLVTSLQQLNPTPRIIAYGSHVAAEALRAAREAGCDEVLPRSAFSERLVKDGALWA